MNFLNNNNMFICDECFQISLKNNNYIIRQDNDGNDMFYHKKCVPNCVCEMCDDDLKGHECIEVLIDWDHPKSFHLKCVKKSINIAKYDICCTCYKAFRVKCLECKTILSYCYGECSYHNQSNGEYNDCCAECNW
jgi:hypothetical protein